MITPKIHLRQMGAGSGKTYESVKLINTQPYKKYVYLTKLHSAKSVIHSKFEELRQQGFFNNGHFDFSQKNKKYEGFVNDKDVLICTVDSFNTRMHGNERSRESEHENLDFVGDIFTKICEEIEKGNSNNSLYLSPDSVVIVDEIQDLPMCYIFAFVQISSKYGASFYLIGDVLQSIFREDNIFSERESLEKEIKEKYPEIVFEYENGPNIVKRFENQLLGEYVNKIMEDQNGVNVFQEYKHIGTKRIFVQEQEQGLFMVSRPFPAIEQFYDNPPDSTDEDDDSEYDEEDIHSSESSDSSDSSDSSNSPEPLCEDKNGKIIKNIIRRVKKELARNPEYGPNNFMFVSPTVQKNRLLNELQASLNDFWAGIHRKKGCYDPQQSQYVQLHRSEEGTPINLDESKNKSRILSIHASKGSGADVVFVIDVSKIGVFTSGEKNLKYYSLLYVALTRAKKSMYICDRNFYYGPSQRILSKYVKVKSVKNNTITTIEQEFLQGTEESSPIKNVIHKILKSAKEPTKNKGVVDYNNHLHRHSAMRYVLQCIF